MTTASIYALSAQTVLGRSIDVIADNIANASTPGYKRAQLQFSDYLSKVGTDRAAKKNDINRDFVEGNLTHTGNPLDVAIKGEGFFAVKTPQGVLYTRGGRFSIDAEGNLVTANGDKVLSDSGGPITFAPTDRDIAIDPRGRILANGGEVSTIKLVRFADPQALERAGNGLYFAKGQKALAVEKKDTQLVQGAIEESNVVPILELTQMMSAMRSFESAQRVSQSEHDRIRRTIQILSQT